MWSFRRSDRAPVRETRGGVAGGAVITGVVVAFGAMFLLSAIVGGVLVALDATGTLTEGEAIEAGVGAGMALVVAQFLSYLWGGYTAGRMARGAGAVNGLLVPIVALVVAAGVAGLVAALGADANLNLPLSTNRLPLDDATVVDWGIGIGVAALVAMFLGGIVGGGMGARWHTKLERAAYEEEHGTTAHTVVVNERRTDSTVDLREGERRDLRR